MSGGYEAEVALGQARLGALRGRWRMALLLVMMMGTHPGLAWGQSGATHPNQGGQLRLDVDTRWPDGPGYRPVRVTVTPLVPVAANRTLVFEFTTSLFGLHEGEDRCVVAQEIELPAGTGPVTTTIAVPYVVGYDEYEYRVGEGGLLIPGLVGRGSFQRHSLEENTPRVLFVSEQAANSGSPGIVLSVPVEQSGDDFSQYELRAFTMADANNLPARWIDYSALDMVCLSFADLQDLNANRPEVFRALLEWTAAGGNLLVFGIDAATEQRLALEELLGMPPSILRETGWRPPDLEQYGSSVNGFFPGQESSYDNLVSFQQDISGGDMTEDASKKRKGLPSPPDVFPFVSRPYEMGTVVAITSDAPYEEDLWFWGWLCNHLTSARVIWPQRHGFSSVYGTAEFYRFLVPGVGNAPLNAFRVLITLFVLAIGPLNYYILRRLRRLHLLVVTVPISAAGITLALFAYAILSDGLGTRVRVRSVTQVNQQTGQTECWARLSYYAGLAPRDGLVFSEDVVVHPLVADDRYYGSGYRELRWHDGQRMTTGWLRSRTPTQYLTVRSRRSEIGLDAGEAADGVLPVTNRLGTDVELLVVRDEHNNLHWCRSLAEGRRADAERVEVAEAVAALSEGVNACDMLPPPGMNNQVYVELNGKGAKGLMEGVITDLIQPSNRLKGLEARSYVAIVRFSPEVELGMSPASPVASLHLVVGSW